MASTFTYRPKQYSVEQLIGIARKRHTNLNRLIESALVEKIHREEVERKGGDVEVLTEKLKRVVVEHLGVRLVKPDKKTRETILQKMRETDPKDLISDRKVRPQSYK